MLSGELKYKNMETKISDLIGKTVISITRKQNEDGDDELIFICDTGEKYKMYHKEDCCEDVSIKEISGDLNTLIGTPILKAEEKIDENEGEYESYTWTFYTISTIKGYVDISWYGESNGYYSEAIDFVKFN